MIRRSIIVILAVIVAGALFQRLFGDDRTVGAVQVPIPAATVESEGEVLAVTPNGFVVRWFPLADESELPELPSVEPPKSGRLAGSMLEQARVLGAAPAALRPHLARSYYGESGVDVETTSGIELRFGDASQAPRKWRAAAAVLADPSIEALDYVNVNAPGRPSFAGSGHTLPPPP